MLSSRMVFAQNCFKFQLFFSTEKLTPLAFETQPKLLSVNLTNTLITDIQKGTFVNMTRLVRLILTRNRIKRIEESVLAGNFTSFCCCLASL